MVARIVGATMKSVVALQCVSERELQELECGMSYSSCSILPKPGRYADYFWIFCLF
jgi:hypothetical protein